MQLSQLIPELPYSLTHLPLDPNCGFEAAEICITPDNHVLIWKHYSNLKQSSMTPKQLEMLQQFHDYAITHRYPVIACISSFGANLESPQVALNLYAECLAIFQRTKQHVWLLTIAFDQNAGGSSILHALGDIRWAVKDSKRWISGPKIMDEVNPNFKKNTSNGSIQNTELDAPHFESLQSAIEAAIPYLAFLHYPAQLQYPTQINSQNTLVSTFLLESDWKNWLNLSSKSQSAIWTGISYFNSKQYGILCSNFAFEGGSLRYADIQHMLEFVLICRAKQLPLLFLIDTIGISLDPEELQTPLFNRIREWINCLQAYPFPRFTYIFKHGIGGAAELLNPKQMGATLVYSAPNACISAMHPDLISKIIDTSSPPKVDPQAALQQGIIDGILDFSKFKQFL